MDDIRPADEPDESSHAPTPSDIPEAYGASPPSSADELRKRLEDAERELAKVQAERDEYKAAAYSFLGQLIPFEPMTEEESHELMHAPPGQPISEIIEEYERKYLPRAR